MHTVTQDIRFAVRALRRRPALTAVVVITLALGIGVNAAMFTVVDRVVIRPLPFPDSERLTFIWGTHAAQPGRFWWTSFPDFADFEAESRTMAQLAAFRTRQINLTGPEGDPQRLNAATVTHDLFATLGVQPQLGRGFSSDEDLVGGASVAILSHGLWQQRFGGDSTVLGRTVTVDNQSHAVVGIMPASFQFTPGTDIWLPLGPDAGSDSRGMHRLRVVGRLAPTATPADATAEFVTIAKRLEAAYPASNADRTAWVQSMHEVFVFQVRTAMLVMLGAVSMVLLIACVNVANLLLARAASRAREVAVRAALGAGRLRLVRQLLTESVILALGGGVVGLAVGYASLRAFVALSPPNIPRLDEAVMDGRILLVLLATTLASGILFGLVPALRTADTDVQAALKNASRGLAGGAGKHRIQRLLVVSELGLCVILVFGAGLLLKSFVRLLDVDPGFRPDNVLVMRVSLPEETYETPVTITEFFDRLVERTAALPGVRSASVAYAHPLDPSWESSFQIEGVVEAPAGQRPEARLRPISPDYFQTMGIPLLAGRTFTERDDAGAPGAVIINATMAREFFRDQNPLGHRFVRTQWWPDRPASFEIVGVVDDVKFDGLTVSPGRATYFPHHQMPFNEMYLAVHTDEDPLPLANAVRSQIWALDPTLPADNVDTMRGLLGRAVQLPRFNMLLLGFFAALAVILAAVGVYGVVSYSVSQRTGELGIRRALGAGRMSVMAMVIRQGMALVLAGVGIGLAGAAVLSRMASSLLFEVSATDPLTFLTVAVGLSLVAVVACLVPARRALRVSPTEALRYE